MNRQLSVKVSNITGTTDTVISTDGTRSEENCEKLSDSGKYALVLPYRLFPSLHLTGNPSTSEYDYIVENKKSYFLNKNYISHKKYITSYIKILARQVYIIRNIALYHEMI